MGTLSGINFSEEKFEMIEQQLGWWRTTDHQKHEIEHSLKFHNKKIWNFHWRREWC